MKKLADVLGFQVEPDSVICKLCPKLGNLLGQSSLIGNLRGKDFEIFSTKLSQFKQFPTRLVVKSQILPEIKGELNISIKFKPLFFIIRKILDRNFIESGDRILDKRLSFTCQNPESALLFQKLISFEEICDQMCDVWTNRTSPGILLINNISAIYHEPFRWLTNKSRERIKNAANLICDIIDVIKTQNLTNNVQS